MRPVLVLLAVAVHAFGSCWPLEAQSRGATPPAAGSVFSFIDSVVTDGLAPTSAEFDRILLGEGFKKDDSSVTLWRLKRADGELRVIPSFESDRASVSLMYFPATPGRVPDPVLSWLLERQTYSRLNDGDELVIGLPEKQLSSATNARGRRVEEITVSVNGGTLVKTRVHIEWKR